MRNERADGSVHELGVTSQLFRLRGLSHAAGFCATPSGLRQPVVGFCFGVQRALGPLSNLANAATERR